MIWEWRQEGRRWSAILLVGGLWAGLALLWLVFAAHPAFLLILFAVSLPAAWDIGQNRHLALEVHADQLIWTSGVAQDALALDAGTVVSLRRRFDGGLRIAVTNRFGQDVRLPPYLDPPLGPLEAALQQSAAKVRRDPFRFI